MIERPGDQVRQILSGDEFGQQTFANPIVAWLEDIAARIARGLLDLWPDGRGPADLGLTLGYVAIGLLVALALLVVVLVVSRYWPQPKSVAVYGRIEEARAAPSEVLIAWAEEAERLGQWRRALILYFWAFLKVADRAGLVRYSDPKTNWEVLASRTQRYLPLWAGAEASARRFDEVLYLGVDAGPGDVSGIKGLIVEAESYRAVAA